MKPVKQTVLFGDQAIGNGNCIAACYASLLDIPLWMVPPWEQMFGRGDHCSRQDAWLKRMFGLRMVRIYNVDKPHWLTDEDNKELEVALSKLPEFYMACGYTARNTHHATIYSAGKLVHDPHYSNEGLTRVDRIEYLEKIADEVLEEAQDGNENGEGDPGLS